MSRALGQRLQAAHQLLQECHDEAVPAEAALEAGDVAGFEHHVTAGEDVIQRIDALRDDLGLARNRLVDGAMAAHEHAALTVAVGEIDRLTELVARLQAAISRRDA